MRVDAESGLNNDRWMTPLRTAQAIAVLAPPPTWASVINKPATFAPSAHTHLKAEITGLPADLAALASADTLLGDEIDTLASALSLETAARISGDQSLSGGLNDVITALAGKQPTITTLPISKGGTGATTATGALTALGAEPVFTTSYIANPTVDTLLTAGRRRIVGLVSAGLYNGGVAKVWLPQDGNLNGDIVRFQSRFFVPGSFEIYTGIFQGTPADISQGRMFKVGTLTKNTDSLTLRFEGGWSIVTVDLHTHSTSDVTGLQTALDTKAPTTALTTETQARIAGDSLLGGRIDTLSAAVTSADTLLGDEIDTLASALSLETAARISGDQSLSGGLNDVITALAGKQPTGTYATLVGGLVPSSQLPSYVDDVLEFANLAAFPATGESGKIYVTTTAPSKAYRWSGSAYLEISPSEVTSVAGKTGAVTLAKADVGLPNVDNTSDANKPVSTATQTALDGKRTLPTDSSHAFAQSGQSLALQPARAQFVRVSMSFANGSASVQLPSSGQNYDEVIVDANVGANCTLNVGSVELANTNQYYGTGRRLLRFICKNNIWNLYEHPYHTHTASQITDFASAVVAVSPPVDWSSLTGKPTTFPPTTHTHPATAIIGLSDYIIASAPSLSIVTTTHTADGLTDTYSVSGLTSSDPSAVLVSLNGVTQNPATDYTVNLASGTIIFDGYPSAGQQIVFTALGLRSVQPPIDPTLYLYAFDLSANGLTTYSGRLLNADRPAAPGLPDTATSWTIRRSTLNAAGRVLATASAVGSWLNRETLSYA